MVENRLGWLVPRILDGRICNSGYKLPGSVAERWSSGARCKTLIRRLASLFGPDLKDRLALSNIDHGSGTYGCCMWKTSKN